ncbi:MAG: phytanoyl-CoA dioxygenase family protein [Pseudomonadota bacterium]
MTAEAFPPVPAYGVVEHLPAVDGISEHFANLLVNGYTVLDSGFSDAFLDRIREKMDLIYGTQVADLGGANNMAQIFDTDIARCLLSYDADFIDVACATALREVCERYLGPEFVLMQQNGVTNRPERENYQKKWHRDLSYQHWTSTRPIAMNALLCVDEFTCVNGATHVLPATHHIPPLPTPGFVARNELQIPAPRGAFIVMDAMVFHRAGWNQSSSPRRGINHLIGLPFLAQQIDVPSAIARKGAMVPQDPWIRKYLGYRWAPALDADDWRRRRL